MSPEFHHWTILFLYYYRQRSEKILWTYRGLHLDYRVPVKSDFLDIQTQ